MEKKYQIIKDEIEGMITLAGNLGSSLILPEEITKANEVYRLFKK